MSQPLPSGFVDVGILASISFSGSVRILMGSGIGAWIEGRTGGFIPYRLEDRTLVSGSGCPPGQAQALYQVALVGPNVPLSPPNPVTWVVGPTSGACMADPYLFTSDFAFSGTASNYRLGVRERQIDPAAPAPEFWSNDLLEYAWFADEFTTLVESFAGFNTGTLYAGPPTGAWGVSPTPGMTPIPVPLEQIGWGFDWHGGGVQGPNDIPGRVVAVWTNLTINGVLVDTTELNTGHLVGAQAVSMGDNVGGAASADVPVVVHYHLNVSKFGGAAIAAEVLDNWLTVVQEHSVDHTHKTPQVDFLALPYDATFTIPHYSWETHQKEMPPSGDFHFDLLPSWASAQDPPLPADDYKLPLLCAPARIDPTGAFGHNATYAPLGFSFHETLLVLRSGNPWVGLPAGDVAIAGSTFVVSGAGAQVRRNIAEHWRHWTAFGDPLFGIENYQLTKHDALPSGGSDDVWAWASHPRLTFGLSAPGAASLVLQVDGIYLEVNDPHTSDHTRIDDYTTTEHAFSYTYPFSVVAGANAVQIDLNFPSNATGPVYLERVDAIRITGLKVGTYVISGMTLLGNNATVKLQTGPPVQRGDYSFLWPVVGGTAPLLNWPDQANKNGDTGAGEIGTYGGGMRHITPLTGGGTGTILDIALSILQVGAAWNGLEGWDVTYSAAAFDAANRDPFGNAIGGELAQWLRPVVPSGGLSDIKASPTMRALRPANGHNFLLEVDYPLWGAGEILVGQSGVRAPAGIAIDAIRTDTSAVVNSGVTDADGYCRLVVPANANRAYALEAVGSTPIAGLPIRHHDVVRFSGQLARLLKGVANLQDPLGRYSRADVSDAGRIIYRASNFATPPFAAEGDVTTGVDSEPRLARAPNGTIALVWTRVTDVFLGTSTDWGATFTAAVAFPGARHPAIAIDPATGILTCAVYSSGALLGCLQAPGELTPTVFNVAPVGGGSIAIEDDSLDLAYGPDGRLWAVVRLSGAGNVALLRSSDRGRSFDLLASVLTGGKHPTLTFTHTGILIAAAVIGAELHGVTMASGESVPGAPFTFKKAGGVVLSVADDAFHLAQGHEGRARVVLAVRSAGETLASDWASADLGSSFDSVS